ncbi:hypothetical protein PYE51_01510 [Vibrio aestuarianus]|uniref:Uncharacterized protein n=1 Tax=Vibrio aestuarianus TaxID=28171 RepID=A0AAX3U5A7_9VIBR|nr:hypothetical protein [Vibrio aestuarianus]WGK81958.1 hypothetical protein PYE51_01510 [Vibrio aestuarianus]
MLFWTPVLPALLQDWLGSTTEQVLCCEVDIWNCTGSSEFERRISDIKKCLCVALSTNGEQVDVIIEKIWQCVVANNTLVDNFIERNSKFRRYELQQQVNSGIQPDLSIYDCVDILSRISTPLVLCIRLGDSVPVYLKDWLNYIHQYTAIKVLLLYPKAISRLGRLQHFERLTLPVLSKGSIIEACKHAVYRLTETHIQSSELERALSYSYSLDDFISIIQTAIMSQCTIETLLSSTLRTGRLGSL